ncbi:MAG: DUF2911 domain-containing protein [Gemmatimonadota bacterium]
MRNRIALLAVLFLLAAAALSAQGAPRVKPSQTGTVSQEVGSTRISLQYDRPVARGRELFGTLVKWGSVWSPSANTATIIDLSEDVTVQGERLAKGKYSIWSIPGEQEWTLIFNKKERVHHAQYPEGEDVLRVKTKPEQGNHLETLAYYFPVVGPDSAVMRLHWGTTIVPLTIKTTK